jgi:hypothetical protein
MKKRSTLIKSGSTLFLRFVVSLIGFAVLTLCIFVLPSGIRTTHNWTGYRPILLGMYIPAIPFFFALYQIFTLLNYIDKNKAFSSLSIKALKYIKYCAVSISVLYGVSIPYIFSVAQKDDAPGVVLLGLIFTFAPMIVAVISAILQMLLQNAIHLKSENELTV